MFRCLPPAGHSIHLLEVLRSVVASPQEDLFLKNLCVASPCFFVSSGTAALYLSLVSIGDNLSKRKVVLPAYTCPSLLAAVVKARLEPVLCDLEPNTFRLDPEKITEKLGETTLGVIAVHLFGMPENVKEIRKQARESRVVVIEDAAQGLGNRLHSDRTSVPENLRDTNRECILGTIGDIGLLSFGRGKPLSLLGGGAVLVNNTDFLDRVKNKYAQIDSKVQAIDGAVYAARLVGYSVFFHPSLYGIPAKMPGLKLGETHFRPNFDVAMVMPQIIKIGNVIAKRFEKIRKTRLHIANMYRKSLERFREDFAFIPDRKDNSDGVALLRFPIVFKKKERRDCILEKLRAEGLGATAMYPAPLNEIRGASSFVPSGEAYPVAKFVSERILTLPIHEHVDRQSIEKIVNIFELS